MAFRVKANNHFGGKAIVEMYNEHGELETTEVQVAFKRPTQKEIEKGELPKFKVSELLKEYLVSVEIENEDGQRIPTRDAQLAAVMEYPELGRALCELFFRGVFHLRDSSEKKPV